MCNFWKSGRLELEAGAAERNMTFRRFYEVFFLFSSCCCWSPCEFVRSCSIFLREVLWKCETRQIYHQGPLCVIRKNRILASKDTHFNIRVTGLFWNILWDLMGWPALSADVESWIQVVKVLNTQKIRKICKDFLYCKQTLIWSVCGNQNKVMLVMLYSLMKVAHTFVYCICVFVCSGSRRTPWTVWRSSRWSWRPWGCVIWQQRRRRWSDRTDRSWTTSGTNSTGEDKGVSSGPSGF